MALLATRKSKISALIDKFLSLVSRLNVLFVHPNWHDYPVFCRRTNAEISNKRSINSPAKQKAKTFVKALA